MCNNPKLQDYVTAQLSGKAKTDYERDMARVKEVASGQKDMVLKDTAQQVAESKAQALRNNLLIALSAIVVLLLVIVWIRRKQSSQRE